MEFSINLLYSCSELSIFSSSSATDAASPNAASPNAASPNASSPTSWFSSSAKTTSVGSIFSLKSSSSNIILARSGSASSFAAALSEGSTMSIYTLISCVILVIYASILVIIVCKLFINLSLVIGLTSG